MFKLRSLHSICIQIFEHWVINYLEQRSKVDLPKMWIAQQKALIVQVFIRTGHIIEAQRFVRTTMNRHPPADSTIRRWHQNSFITGDVQQRPRSGRPRTSGANINLVRQLYSTQPTISIRDAELQLQIPRSTIQRILKKLFFCILINFRLFKH